MEAFGRVVGVPAGAASLYGELNVPEGAGSSVVMIVRALGIGGPLEADCELAKRLAEEGQATLVVDLLESGERERREEIYEDPSFLPNRLIAVAWWLLREPSLYEPVVGVIGMPSAAAAALRAAGSVSDVVRSLVVIDGQPIVESELLEKVAAPTLLIVGARDAEGLEAHRQVLAALHVEKRLDEIPGAGEALSEPIEWRQVGERCEKWLSRYLDPSTRGRPASSVGSQVEQI